MPFFFRGKKNEKNRQKLHRRSKTPIQAPSQGIAPRQGHATGLFQAMLQAASHRSIPPKMEGMIHVLYRCHQFGEVLLGFHADCNRNMIVVRI